MYRTVPRTVPIRNRHGRLPREPRETQHMRVGVPKEIKPDEYRVGMMPVGAESLIKAGHEVMVEAGAGVSSGCLTVRLGGG